MAGPGLAASEGMQAELGLRYNIGPFPTVSPDMIVLEGLPALSQFRLARLQSRLQAIHPDTRVTGAWFNYWVEPGDGAIGAPDLSALHRILQAAPTLAGHADPAMAIQRFVTPRIGTISPWSSKATELLHGARLPIQRVERGMRIELLG